MKENVRILLGETASKALLETGECFVIAGKASVPDPAGRVAVHFVPVDKGMADKLCEVLMGRARVVRIKEKKEGD